MPTGFSQDLDLLDWPDHLKKLQINWIGRSEGAKIHFVEEKTQEAHHRLYDMPRYAFWRDLSGSCARTSPCR